MEKTFLVIDLRRNQYAAGLLTIKGEKLDWYAESIFQVCKDWETGARDATAVVDLSFFRRPKERQWSPLLHEALKTLDKSSFEYIESLFDEPPERLQDLLPGTLGRLLKATFNQYERVSNHLLLVQKAETREVIEKKYSKLIASKEIRVALLDQPGAWGGFALTFNGLDAKEQPKLPRNGTTWLCEFDDPPEKKRYVWNNGQFSVQEFQTDDHGPVPSKWKSADELERIGASVFSIFWGASFAQTLDKQIEQLEGQLAQDRLLLNRMQEIYNRLTTDHRVLTGRTA